MENKTMEEDCLSKGDLQEVCHKLDTVIQLLKDLQVNLNINGDGCNVTVFDDGRVRVNRE